MYNTINTLKKHHIVSTDITNALLSAVSILTLLSISLIHNAIYLLHPTTVIKRKILGLLHGKPTQQIHFPTYDNNFCLYLCKPLMYTSSRCIAQLSSLVALGTEGLSVTHCCQLLPVLIIIFVFMF